MDDRSNWILGWSNHERVEDLRNQKRALDQQIEGMTAAMSRLEAHAEQLRQDNDSLQRAKDFTWADIDVDELLARRNQLQQQLDSLKAGSVDLQQLSASIEELESEQGALRDQQRDNDRLIGQAEQALASARELLTQAQETTREHPVDAQDASELAQVCRGERRSVNSLQPQQAFDNGQKVLTKRRNAASDQINLARRKMHEIQTAYVTDWPQFSTNMTTDLHDVPEFVNRLAQLESDNLPRFEEHFRTLLREQTQKEISSLAMEIDSYFKGVKRRIDPVNASLAQTPYNKQRHTFLRIEPTHVFSRDTREFLADLKEITSGQLSSREESAQEAEQRYLRIEKLMNKLSSQDSVMLSWQREVLDTRRHVSFRAIEYTADGDQVDVYESSAGRSGGQSQKLVTFALAAALRYQLADPGTYVPRYGTVVLDEAFDKTDAEFARASLDIFATFGFQLVMASPMKMNQTVEPYVGGVVQTRLADNHHTELAFAVYERESPDA